MAQAIEIPSYVLVPRPISSKSIKHLSERLFRILAVSFISTIKVDSPIEILSLAPTLVKSHASEELTEEMKAVSKEEMQLSFFKLDDPLLEELREEILDIDIDTLTPVEALMKLNEIRRMLQRNASVKLKK